MPFKKPDENEAREIRSEIERKNGPVTYIENPFIEDDERVLGNQEMFYCKFGRNWDIFNRFFTDFDEACRTVDTMAKELKDTCVVYSNRVAGPRYSAYGKEIVS